jgi:dTDP-4-dehydrorhamnose 3,5-epimerase-like enzyme
LSLSEVRWLDLPNVTDERGVLTAVEAGSDIPFEIRRIFYMHATPPGVERGGHAHRDTRQVVVPLAGSFDVELFDGEAAKPYRLDDPNRGLYMPRMMWIRLFDFSEHAVCLVLADTHYDRSNSIRSLDAFLAETRRMKGRTG